RPYGGAPRTLHRHVSSRIRVLGHGVAWQTRADQLRIGRPQLGVHSVLRECWGEPAKDGTAQPFCKRQVGLANVAIISTRLTLFVLLILLDENVWHRLF